jgi:hypothetical protein
MQKEKLTLADVDSDVASEKSAQRKRRLDLKARILARWITALDAGHIRQCITSARTRGKSHCVLYTEEKSPRLKQLDYWRLLYRTRIQGKTVERHILEQLEDGQFAVSDGMIGYNHYGNRFQETDFEIRLGWSFTDRHCCVQ